MSGNELATTGATMEGVELGCRVVMGSMLSPLSTPKQKVLWLIYRHIYQYEDHVCDWVEG